MTTHSEQAAQERLDSMVEALMKELLENALYPKGASGAEDEVTKALMASLISPAHTLSQASSFEKVILAVALAPALADALAPALAEALAPAIVKALDTIASPKETGQESASKEDTDKQKEKKRKSYG
jgi:hypothetical protein